MLASRQGHTTPYAGHGRVRRNTPLCVAAAILTLSAVALPVAANAAKPHHHHTVRPTDGTYKGTLHNGVVKVISLKVSSHGTKAQLSLSCNGTPIPYHPLSMSIVNGAFHAHHQLSPGLAWGIGGRFSTSTKASAYFNGQGVCDGRSGNVVLAP